MAFYALAMYNLSPSQSSSKDQKEGKTENLFKVRAHYPNDIGDKDRRCLALPYIKNIIFLKILNNYIFPYIYDLARRRRSAAFET